MGMPWTEFLREVVDDDARTSRAQRLATTLTWCAMGLVGVVLVTALIAAMVVQHSAGWVPVTGAGGLGMLLAAARWLVVRRRRRLDPLEAKSAD